MTTLVFKNEIRPDGWPKETVDVELASNGDFNIYNVYFEAKDGPITQELVNKAAEIRQGPTEPYPYSWGY